MAQLPKNYTSGEQEPREALEPLPADWYDVIIEDSVIKQNSAQTGSYLEMTLKVISGEYANRKIWDRLNLDNPSKTAEEIAWRTLQTIADAVGVPRGTPINDSALLHNKPLRCRVKVRSAKDNYAASNDITGYSKSESPSMSPAATAENSTTQKPTTPW